MSKSILCVKQNHKHICYNMLGIKLKIQCRINKQQVEDFFKHEIKPNTILLIEPNDCHFETLLGLYQILKNLNYNVEILTRGYSENLLCRCNDSIKFWECNTRTFDYIFSNFDFSKYYCLIFNSKRVYWKNNNEKSDGCDIFNCYKKIPKGQIENIYLQHHIDCWNDYKREKQIILANPSKTQELNECIVNSHYFGDIKITGKNAKITKFITVGELNIARRNSELLINAVKKLIKKNINNFEIIVIGSGNLNAIPTELHRYFRILGRVDFLTMFNAMEEADYFLPLLDPEIEKHQRYMKYGTSGSFQLIYGFLKPCIIHKTFADIYGFTPKDSIIYENNDNLYESMLYATNLSQNEYIDKQSNLKIIVENIEKTSLINLKNILDGPFYHIVSLGDDCLVRRYLTRAGLKPSKKQGELTLPFDLSVTPTKSLIKILKKNFSNYFNDLSYSEEKDVWINKKYGILYNHDKDCSSTEKEKLIKRFEKRINNFYQLMSTSPFIFFVCKSSLSLLNILNLYIQLKKIRKERPFKLIILDLKRKNIKIELNNISIYPLKHPFRNSYSWWQEIESESSKKFQKDIQLIIEKNILKHFSLAKYSKEDVLAESGEY